MAWPIRLPARRASGKPFRTESVKHVSGMKCQPCVRQTPKGFSTLYGVFHDSGRIAFREQENTQRFAKFKVIVYYQYANLIWALHAIDL